ncbi:MAG: hypothetical protein WCC57_00725, partial [Paracoccaceae bacterium]
ATASHSPAILEANLKLSPMLATGAMKLHVETDAPSASIAYNRVLDATTEDIIVFAHHDVFLPEGWDDLLRARIAELTAHDPNWALLGAFGVGMDVRPFGPVWSSSLGMIVGRVPLTPEPVQSFDELLIVLRRDSGLRFDEALPDWHMYGTDIVQTAWAAGKGAYVVALPCIHNDRYHRALGQDYFECYRFMQRKWAARLPMYTPIVKISRSGLHLLRNRWRDWRSHDFRLGMSVETDTDPREYARRCGWGDLRPSV